VVRREKVGKSAGLLAGRLSEAGLHLDIDLWRRSSVRRVVERSRDDVNLVERGGKSELYSYSIFRA
jgi:hypothetical protein